MHFKKEYGSIGEAVKHPDGLAVVGAFLDATEDENAHKAMSSDITTLSQVAKCRTYLFLTYLLKKLPFLTAFVQGTFYMKNVTFTQIK